MDEKPRRWFRFSLRMLFLLVALVAIWLGYHLNWIRQRHAARAWVKGQAEYFDDVPVQQGAFPGAHAPWRIRMLGEDGVTSIWVVVRKEAVDPEQQRLEGLFPEAKVGVYTTGGGYRGKRSPNPIPGWKQGDPIPDKDAPALPAQPSTQP
jgi:hypothetical protein